MKSIKLGYEVGTGKEVNIPLSHIIVTGITQLSGKTTTLEALIKRSGLKAVVFKTKKGEASFSEGTIIPPFFKERADWQFVQSLLEAALRERLKFERSWIIRASKGTKSLQEVKDRVDEFLTNKKMRSMDRDMFTNLAAYLEIILPGLKKANLSSKLELVDGMNIMDLENLKSEVQHLVISSVMSEILNKHRKTIVVMPEAWKHLPEKRGTPCKLAAISLIRQGAAKKNYLWIDSQDITGVDKEPLKQVSTWILGLQLEKNEVDRTLAQMTVMLKPKANEIKTLELGHFYVCTPKFAKLTYAQPAWVSDDLAKTVAMGKKDAGDLKKPKANIERIRLPEPPLPQPDTIDLRPDIAKVQSDIAQIRAELESLKARGPGADIAQIRDELETLKARRIPEVDIDQVVSKVLRRIPKASGGAVVYEVAPLEKINNDFLEASKSKIIEDIRSLNEDERKILKFIEVLGKGVNASNALRKCLFLAQGGPNSKKVTDAFRRLASLSLARHETRNGKCFPLLKDRIKSMMGTFKATDQDIEQLYSYIMMELLK